MKPFAYVIVLVIVADVPLVSFLIVVWSVEKPVTLLVICSRCVHEFWSDSLVVVF